MQKVGIFLTKCDNASQPKRDWLSCIGCWLEARRSSERADTVELARGRDVLRVLSNGLRHRLGVLPMTDVVNVTISAADAGMSEEDPRAAVRALWRVRPFGKGWYVGYETQEARDAVRKLLGIETSYGGNVRHGVRRP